MLITELAMLGVDIGSMLIKDTPPEGGMVESIATVIKNYRTSLSQLRNEALEAMVNLTPGERERYLEALQERNKGNTFVYRIKQHTHAGKPITWAHMLNKHQEDWRLTVADVLFDLTLPVACAVGGCKVAAKYFGAKTIIAKFAVRTATTVATIQNTVRDQDRDAQIYFFSLLALAEAKSNARNIYKNTAAGLIHIIEARPITPIEGKILQPLPDFFAVGTLVSAMSTAPFPLDLMARRAYVEVRVRNDGPEITEYRLYATHPRTVATRELGWGLAHVYIEVPSISTSRPFKLDPGEKKTVRIMFYCNKRGGFIPDGDIQICLIARDGDRGIFRLDSTVVNLGTTFIDEQGNIIPEAETERIRILEYPVRSELWYRPGTDDFELTIFLTNHWEIPLAVGLEQPVPPGVEVICAGDGIWDQNQNRIVWELNLKPREITIVRVTLRPQGEAVTLEMPGAILAMHDRINNAWVDFQSSSTVAGELEVEPVLSVTPDLNFGEIIIGQSKDLSFTVANTGGGALIGSVFLPLPPGSFSIVGDDFFSLEAGLSTLVTVRFSPTATATGTVTDTVSFNSNAGNLTRSVSGVGVAVALKGDINNSGPPVDIFDVILCLRMALELPVTIEEETHQFPYPAELIGRADMDANGIVNIFDVIRVLRVALELDP